MWSPRAKPIALSGWAHPASAVVASLHFGVRLDGVYQDPFDYLTPIDVSSMIRLAPWALPRVTPRLTVARPRMGDLVRRCSHLFDAPTPFAVGGIGHGIDRLATVPAVAQVSTGWSQFQGTLGIRGSRRWRRATAPARLARPDRARGAAWDPGGVLAHHHRRSRDRGRTGRGARVPARRRASRHGRCHGRSGLLRSLRSPRSTAGGAALHRGLGRPSARTWGDRPYRRRLDGESLVQRRRVVRSR